MTSSPNNSSAGQADARHLEALLRETPWIQRLARGMLADNAAAEDLSQEVLIAAMGHSAGVRPSSLRAWLRTVARRLLARKREEERAREWVEGRAARPEAVEQNAHDRLQLHRRLTAAIDELAPPYRAVLVLRYLEELPPLEIAARLGLSPTAARKRVSRGLAMLRETLDAEFDGGRRSWAVAVAGLLTPNGGSILSPSVEPRASGVGPAAHLSAAALPTFAFMTKKTLLVTLTLLVAMVGALLWQEPLAPLALNTPISPSPATATAPAIQSEDPRSPAEVLSDGEQRRAMVSAPEIASAPRVRVLQASGEAIAEASVAWMDRAGHPQGLALDSEGSAMRPEGSGGSAFFACAPGFGEGYVSAGPMDGDVEIVLEPARVLRGRLIENGTTPAHSVYLWVAQSGRDRGVGDVWGTREKIEQLGAMRNLAGVWTRPDGTFEFSGLQPGGTGGVYLPTTHCAYLEGTPVEEKRIRFTASDDELVIETLVLPTVRGRLLWADDGTPVVGSLDFIRENRNTGSSAMAFGHANAQGFFAVGLPVRSRALLGPPDELPDALEHRAVRIYLDRVNGVAVPLDLRVELKNKTFPIDLGVLTVERANSIVVRVVSPEGEPVEGASVTSSLGSAFSDTDGRAQLSLQTGDELQVLAPGYAYGSFPVSLLVGSDEPQQLRLEPGHTLAVVLASVDGGGPDMAIPVQLAWEQSPFEGAHISGEPPFAPLPPRIHRHFHGTAMINGGFSTIEIGAPGSQGFTPPATGNLLIPGLRAGSSFTLQLVDAFEEPLAERTVTMPMGTGIHRVRLDEGLIKASRLRVRIVDGKGEPMEVHGSVFVGREKGPRTGASFEIDSGFTDVALAAGKYKVVARADGYLHSTVSEYWLTPKSPVLEFVLEPARALQVSFVGESGRPVSPASVKAKVVDGWNNTQHGTARGQPEAQTPSTYSSSSTGPGGATFRRVPLHPLELSFRVGTRTYTEAIDTEQTSALVTLPNHGLVILQFSHPPQLAAESGRIRIRIRETNGEGHMELRKWFSDETKGVFEFEAELLPGSYQLRVDLIDYVEDAQEDDPALVRPIDERRFTVKANEETRLEIED